MRFPLPSIALVFVLAFGAARGEAPVYPEHQDLTYYINAFGKKNPVLIDAAWEVRRRHILDQMQRVMGRLPAPCRPVSLDVKVVESRSFAGFVRRKITYHTDSKDRRVAAYLFLPTGEPQKRPRRFVPASDDAHR